ncbi:MAG TPA: hypothetical protein VF116_11465 [Ktedonobacterales bacterium]
MGEPDQEHENQLVDRLLWLGIASLFVVGLLLAVLPGTSLFHLDSLLQNVGYGLLGGSLTAVVFRLTTGLSDKWQQERTDQAFGSLQKYIAEQEKHVSDLSKLLATANSLGVAALIENRDALAFSNMTWAQRFDYMLQHCEQVDLLCYEDGRIFTRDRWLQPGLPEQIVSRLRAGKLTLRILLSTVENPVLNPINDWIGIEEYMQRNVNQADDFLRQAKITTQFPVLQRHNELLPFTLMRGDDEMYIMYFFPKGHASPIIQVAPPPLHGDAHTGETQRNLFKKYRDYFDTLWTKYDPKKQAGGHESSPSR